ncbi:hypothetical protein EW146_g1618 [Bondarzewia mesenterica]|uniref:Uncharacterized protein n=1 Tax=Bondarzewia mesenterica TaxID=1095465 RepID=A0A4S4M9G0_9AGAM|nr:hypothetical protein EW146_g1618 [Bondarzewia mesenterica]
MSTMPRTVVKAHRSDSCPPPSSLLSATPNSLDVDVLQSDEDTHRFRYGPYPTHHFYVKSLHLQPQTPQTEEDQRSTSPTIEAAQRAREEFFFAFHAVEQGSNVKHNPTFINQSRNVFLQGLSSMPPHAFHLAIRAKKASRDALLAEANLMLSKEREYDRIMTYIKECRVKHQESLRAVDMQLAQMIECAKMRNDIGLNMAGKDIGLDIAGKDIGLDVAMEKDHKSMVDEGRSVTSQDKLLSL